MTRQKPRKARPGLIDRIRLAASYGRKVDGIWIGDYYSPEHLPCIEGALLLIKQHSPVHYARIVRDLERIWIYLLRGGMAEYQDSLSACVLDRRYVEDWTTTEEDIALAIVHEATHARLARCGIAYTEDRRARIEAVCVRRELALAARLPRGAQLRQDRARDLKWYQANPDYFRDLQFT
jgi:hypothetical protein